MTKPFRFAVQLHDASSREDWIARVRKAEALGYDVVSMPDHISTQLSPFPALVAAAEAAERVRLCVFVADNDFRNPVLLAQEAATVHLLTEGRFELGIGAGWNGVDYTRTGIPFEAPKVRLGKMKEAVEILDRYFAGETFSFEGEHYNVQEVEPVPVEGKPKLVIGGGGPRILEFAAQHADVISVFLTSLRDGGGFEVSDLQTEEYAKKIELVRRVAGDRDIELNVLMQHVEQKQDRGDEGDLPFGVTGTVEQMADTLLARRERYGISYITVFERHSEVFAPVIESLKGLDDSAR
jgi:probable F420-dependent oxidoreductase